MSKNEYLGIRTTKEVKEFLKNQAKIKGEEWVRLKDVNKLLKRQD